MTQPDTIVTGPTLTPRTPPATWRTTRDILRELSKHPQENASYAMAVGILTGMVQGHIRQGSPLLGQLLETLPDMPNMPALLQQAKASGLFTPQPLSPALSLPSPNPEGLSQAISNLSAQLGARLDTHKQHSLCEQVSDLMLHEMRTGSIAHGGEWFGRVVAASADRIPEKELLHAPGEEKTLYDHLREAAQLGLFTHQPLDKKESMQALKAAIEAQLMPMLGRLYPGGEKAWASERRTLSPIALEQWVAKSIIDHKEEPFGTEELHTLCRLLSEATRVGLLGVALPETSRSAGS